MCEKHATEVGISEIEKSLPAVPSLRRVVYLRLSFTDSMKKGNVRSRVIFSLIPINVRLGWQIREEERAVVSSAYIFFHPASVRGYLPALQDGVLKVC